MQTLSLTLTQALRLRAGAQRLGTQKKGCSPADVVEKSGGLQAQDLPAAVLGVRARSAGLTAAGVEQARLEERSIVWTWAMRGTLHLITAKDFAWLIPLLGPIFIASGRRRRLQLGWDEDSTASGLWVIREALAASGPLTRKEIAGRLRAHGLPSEGQATVHILYLAALEGTLCMGPDRNGKPTYVLVRDWFEPGKALPREAALAEIARRYLAAFGPAGPEDLAAWSGLGVKDARVAWDAILGRSIEVEIAGRPAWLLRRDLDRLDEPSPHSPVVRLLPRYDNYLLGYASREPAVEARYAKRIHPGGGIIHASLVADGRVLGTWSSRSRRDRLEVTVEPFGELPVGVQSGLEEEAADLGRFLGITGVLI